ncbi:alkaline phosphatase synthesis sensor protein PhoR [Geobacter sp. OR-1]|uniref:sensor histidine kinase n=1 Tax=Geobacter sp. OR-1 TaxID=1266765 RepID=UPI0005433C7F|nr:ATP-binding protein [Geobacter sp. OR-1]GAM09707.1 alkaline phosphatase synthesis sensor protein PhoR [Geobacter sp. OR-1]
MESTVNSPHEADSAVTGKITGGPGLAESLLENLSVGLVMVDNEGTICYLNQSAERILQISRHEVLGKRVYMLPLRTAIYKLLGENCRDYHVEMNLHGLVIQAKATSVICREGSCLGDMYELRDISQERREQRQSDEFVATMTHDLKSPLTVMLGYVDALSGDPDVSRRERAILCLAEMKRSGHRLQGMIEDIIDSYRLDAGLVEIRRDFCDVGKILNECCTELAQDAETHGIGFKLSLEPGLPIIKADARQLGRVFSNLIGNAIKFTPKGGEIRVSGFVSATDIVVQVSDTGIGIPVKDQERIFNKYYRSEKVKGYKGTGLGLTICKALAEEHGGGIEVASSEGEGSCFTVKIPAGDRSI